MTKKTLNLVVETKQEKTFCKRAIIRSKQFNENKNLLNCLLDDNKRYTIKQVENLINSFLTKEVK